MNQHQAAELLGQSDEDYQMAAQGLAIAAVPFLLSFVKWSRARRLRRRIRADIHAQLAPEPPAEPEGPYDAEPAA